MSQDGKFPRDNAISRQSDFATSRARDNSFSRPSVIATSRPRDFATTRLRDNVASEKIAFSRQRDNVLQVAEDSSLADQQTAIYSVHE